MSEMKDAVIEARLLALEQAIARLNNPGNPGHINKSDMVTIRDYFESRLAAVEKATNIAAASMEKRLNGMNEFRETLEDQARRFVIRDEMEAKFAAVTESLKELRTFKDQMEGKASASSVYIAYGISIIGLVIGIVSLFR